MIERPKISDRESQRRAWQRAMTVRGFCESVGIGRTRFYQEVNAGRLRVRKVGRKTIVTADDVDSWLNNLPALHEPVLPPETSVPAEVRCNMLSRPLSVRRDPIAAPDAFEGDDTMVREDKTSS